MSEEALERIYTINLGKVLLSPNNQRAKRAINMIREFATKHMKSENVKIEEDVSHLVWERGIRHPPRKIRVKISKDDDGNIIVSKYQEEKKAGEEKPKKEEKKVEEKPKKDEKKVVEEKPKTEEKKAEEKPKKEEPKEEKKVEEKPKAKKEEKKVEEKPKTEEKKPSETKPAKKSKE
ncbi:MAG: 60S ribosomal protein L31 [Thaumarchaeota archaeon]|nr:60S ribosomal protein L31 [Nitrososphaerota archaeon]